MIDRKPFGTAAAEKPAAHYVLPDHIFPDLIQHVRPDRCLLCVPGCGRVCKRSRRRLLPCDRPDRGHHHHSRLRNRLCAVQKAWCKGKGEGCRRCWLHVLSLAHLRRAGHACGPWPVRASGQTSGRLRADSALHT